MEKELIYLNDSFDDTVNRLVSDDELEGCELSRENVSKTLISFQGDEIAASVFLKKYALRNNDNVILEFTLEEAKDRWAKAILEGDKKFSNSKDEKYFRELYDYFLPAGRQMFALGNDYVEKATLINCYVTKIDDDSIEGIFDAARKIARTYSYGGGTGLCIGELRPKDSKVSNTSKFSTGAVSFMKLYPLVTELIGQQGRRAALLMSIPVNHPDIEDFIEIKHNTKNIEGANISIKLTDEFMKAVLDDKDFNLEFITSHETIKKTVSARDLWNRIIQSARDSAEPGLLFWDKMVEMSPSDTYERLKVHTTNPCGEQVLPKGGTCCLSSLILHTYVKNPFTDQAEFDFDLFGEMVKRGVRHLDNVVELNIEKHPLEEQKEAATLGRRIGLGITGLADMFAALKIKYDSEDALEFIDSLMEFKMISEYNASIDLAKDRGSFTLYDASKHFSRGFCANLPNEIINKAKQYGLRNVAISTIAPNGSLSIMAQSSGGCEPIFALNYNRKVRLGKEDFKEFSIKHQGVVRFFNTTGEENLPDYWVTAHNINYKNRIKMQAVLQKYIDASISSTINLPKDTVADTIGQIYMDAWLEGLKGITVYREGSREGILTTGNENDSIEKSMDSIIYFVRAEKGDKFYITISYENRDVRRPYQVFVNNYKRSDTESFIKIGNSLVKMLLEKNVDPERVQKYLDRSNNSLVKLTRFLSLSMKTNNLDNALEILNEYGFAGTLASNLHKILSKSVEAKSFCCPICKSANVRMQESCVRCLDCNWEGCN